MCPDAFTAPRWPPDRREPDHSHGLRWTALPEVSPSSWALVGTQPVLLPGIVASAPNPPAGDSSAAVQEQVAFVLLAFLGQGEPSHSLFRLLAKGHVIRPGLPSYAMLSVWARPAWGGNYTADAMWDPPVWDQTWGHADPTQDVASTRDSTQEPTQEEGGSHASPWSIMMAILRWTARPSKIVIASFLRRGILREMPRMQWVRGTMGSAPGALECGCHSEGCRPFRTF
jgi:hypothetical protein